MSPSARTVLFSNIARSQNSGTLPRLWVDISITLPCNFIWRSKPMISSSVLTSIPVNGSSISIIWLSCARALARKTRFLCPPDNSLICLCARSSIPTLTIESFTISWSFLLGIFKIPICPYRPIITTSFTKTGKSQSISSF